MAVAPDIAHLISQARVHDLLDSNLATSASILVEAHTTEPVLLAGTVCCIERACRDNFLLQPVCVVGGKLLITGLVHRDHSLALL
jgi:hypothetical protein